MLKNNIRLITSSLILFQLTISPSDFVSIYKFEIQDCQKKFFPQQPSATIETNYEDMNILAIWSVIFDLEIACIHVLVIVLGKC